MAVRPHGLDHDRVMAAAQRDQATVRDLTPALVRIPSRAGIDPYGRIIDQLSDWMEKPRLDHPPAARRHRSGRRRDHRISGLHPGPWWVLDACLLPRPRRASQHLWSDDQLSRMDKLLTHCGDLIQFGRAASTTRRELWELAWWDEGRVRDGSGQRQPRSGGRTAAVARAR